MSLLSGFLAFFVFLAAISYTIFKTGLNNKIKKFARKSHCFIGYLALIIALIHSILSSSSVKFTSGYLSMFLLILCTVFGMLLKYLKPSTIKRNVHIATCIITSIVVIFHLFSKLLI